MKKLLLLIPAVALVITGGIVAPRVLTKAEQPFDHSQCQYPMRSTNPANGCDNSTPCDPQDAAKGGSGACRDEMVTRPVPKSSQPTTPETPQSPINNPPKPGCYQ